MRLVGKNYVLSTNGVNICSLINTETKDEYIKKPFDAPVFYLNAFVGDKWQKLLPELMSEEELDGGFALKVRFGEKEVFGEIKFVDKDDKIHITVDVRNDEETVIVCETVGPNVYGLSLGDDYKKNVLVYPHHAGELTVNPMDEYRSERFTSFWRAATALTDYGTYKRSINYCGLASMSFMYLYDDSNGLYFGSHDLSFPVTSVIAEVGEKERFVGLSFSKHRDVSYKERYLSGEYVFEVNTFDWHRAKAIYRDYIAPTLRFRNYPDYLDDQWGLNQCYNFKRQGEEPENRFEDIPRMYREGMSYGLNHMFMASWNRGGFDTDYPEYFPDMDLGSPMDFVRGIKYVKDNGGIPTLYINARIFDKESLFANTVGKSMRIEDKDGKEYVETYGTKSFTINCPSDKEWQHRLTDIAEYLVKGYGARGVYLDQLGSAEPFACYNKSHSHSRIGDFNNGYVKILSDLHERITAVDDKAFVLTENIGDIYGSYTFGNLTWNSDPYDEFYNCIKYIFPEFVQINMINPRRYIEDVEKRKKLFYSDIERAMLLGSIMWAGVTVKKLPENVELYEYRDKALKLRSLLQPYIKGATFFDNKYVARLSDGIKATVFESDGGIVAVVGNLDGKKGKVELNLPFSARFEKHYSLGGEEVAVSLGQNAVITVTDKLQFVYFGK